MSNDNNPIPLCVHCNSTNCRGHGYTYKARKRRYYCHDCKKTFVLDPRASGYWNGYTQDVVQQVFAHLLEFTLKSAALKFNVSKRTITNWKKKYNYYPDKQRRLDKKKKEEA